MSLAIVVNVVVGLIAAVVATGLRPVTFVVTGMIVVVVVAGMICGCYWHNSGFYCRLAGLI